MFVLGIFSTLAIMLLFYIMAKLSERFGVVIRMKPIYQYYYVAMGLTAISFITQLLAATVEFSLWVIVLAYHLPLSISVSIAAVITWRYWCWLVTERDG